MCWRRWRFRGELLFQFSQFKVFLFQPISRHVEIRPERIMFANDYSSLINHKSFLWSRFSRRLKTKMADVSPLPPSVYTWSQNIQNTEAAILSHWWTSAVNQDVSPYFYTIKYLKQNFTETSNSLFCLLTETHRVLKQGHEVSISISFYFNTFVLIFNQQSTNEVCPSGESFRTGWSERGCLFTPPEPDRASGQEDGRAAGGGRQVEEKLFLS